MFMTPVSGWMVAEKAAPAAAEAPVGRAALQRMLPSLLRKPSPAKPSPAAVTAAAGASDKPLRAPSPPSLRPTSAPEAAAAAAAKAEDDAKAAAAAKAEDDAKAAAAAKAEDDAKAAAAAKAEEDAKAAAAKAEEDAKAAAAAKAEEDAKAQPPQSPRRTPRPRPPRLSPLRPWPSKNPRRSPPPRPCPPSGPLDGAQCQTALSGLTAKEDIKFDADSAKVSKESLALISKIGAVLGRCPAGVSVGVAGHTDFTRRRREEQDLSQNRAEAV